MKLVMVKFGSKGEGFLFLGNNELIMHEAVLCRTKEGICAGEVMDIPEESILSDDTGAYLPLKQCIGISNEITYELWQEVWQKQQ